ncbi:MAG: hypothetical protein LBB80_05700 [Treponema sp.]|jgi:hypothetical protein|nr:hypothetical protein [Treponema sp.]
MCRSVRSHSFFCGLLIFLLEWLSSCGIEDYAFLYPVSGRVEVEFNSKATIMLSMAGASEYFTHFTIYYRIYISAVSLSGYIGQGDLSTLNPTLDSDYRTFLPYTSNTDTTISTSVGSLFRNRSYQALTVEGTNIEDLLSPNARNKTLTLDFIQIPGTIPVLIIDNTSYKLQRSTGNGLFNPVPQDRYFFNSPELNTNANAPPVSSSINADVAALSGTTADVRYTYVSLYIVATGIDPNFSPVYSAPTFIAILRLPDQA